jgi:2-polyprenyl-3-methyl-5-hydroxy-6-metoxy-1,4-benzoquinol methylase
MTKSKMVEPQYDFLHDYKRESLGMMSNQVWQDDPKRLVFMLARYKFVAKMLAGKKKVAELGCGDGFGSRIVRQEVPELHVFDFDPTFVADIEARQNPKWSLIPGVQDILTGTIAKAPYDAVYSLDVMEHIVPEQEHTYIRNIKDSLNAEGVFIVGMPSLESQIHASPASKEGHVNCKSGKDFKASLLQHFGNVFLFSMHDEVITTAFSPMAHYILAVCTNPKK